MATATWWGYLPGVAGCLARRVAWAVVVARVAVVAIAPAALIRSDGLPTDTLAEVFDGYGPGSLGAWLLRACPLGRV